MAKDSYDFSVRADDASKKGFDAVMRRAKGFATGLKKVITAPFRALTSMQTMALVNNLRTLKNLGEGFIELNAVQERAEAKLKAVLRTTNYAAGQTLGQLKKIASEFQGKTLFGDEEIIDAQAILASFKQVSGGIFNEATGLILDLSSHMNQDLKASALMLGKALNDPVVGLTAMTRAGITFSEAQKAVIKGFVETNQMAKAQGMILAELQTEVGGVAAEMANTSSGALKQFKMALGDLGESVGAAIGPTLTRAAKRAKTFVEGMTGFMKRNMGTISEFIKVWATKIALTVQREFFRAIRAIGHELGYLIGDLGRPLREIVDYFDGDGKAVQQTINRIANAFIEAGNQGTIHFRKANRELKALQPEVKAVTERLRNYKQNAKLDEHVRQWGEVRDRIKVAFAPLRGAGTRIMNPLIAGLRGVKSEAQLTAEAMKKAFADATAKAMDKVKDMAAALAEVQGRIAGRGAEKRELLHEIAISKAETQKERDKLEFNRAREEIGLAQSQKGDERLATLDSARGRLGRLATQGIGKLDPVAQEQIEQRLAIAEREHDAALRAKRDRAAGGLADAQKEHRFREAEQQRQIMNAEAKRKLQPFAQAAIEGGNVIKGFAAAVRQATEAVIQNGGMMGMLGHTISIPPASDVTQPSALPIPAVPEPVFGHGGQFGGSGAGGSW